MSRWLACLAIACSQAAVAQENIKLLPGPFELPARIGPLAFDGKPHKFEQAEFGVAYVYDAPGYSLTVYVYDAGRKDVPDGADTRFACLEQQAAIEGVRRATAYSQVTLRKENLVHLSATDTRPLVREAVFELEREGQEQKSFAWITAAAGHFVKLRFTAVAGHGDDIDKARRDVLRALGDAVKPHLAPVDATAGQESKGVSMNVGLGLGGGQADMEAGFIYLGALSALIDDHPEQSPVCGGTYVPGYADELGAWQLVLVVLESGRGASRNIKTLFDAGKAGFLEELVWVAMHREEWGTSPPEGLTLDSFEPWAKKRLGKFERPTVGTLSFAHPRPIPVEPAP